MTVRLVAERNQRHAHAQFVQVDRAAAFTLSRGASLYHQSTWPDELLAWAGAANQDAPAGPQSHCAFTNAAADCECAMKWK